MLFKIQIKNQNANEKMSANGKMNANWKMDQVQMEKCKSFSHPHLYYTPENVIFK
jgi:hypothetical protein